VGQAFWNVPHPRNPSFTGREAEIAGLRERLARKRKTALAQAISGLGGIGKTQTAVEYAYRYRDEYKAVLWLNAESPLSLKTGCGDIARQMPLPYDKKGSSGMSVLFPSDSTTVGYVEDFLRHDSGVRWFLVLSSYQSVL